MSKPTLRILTFIAIASMVSPSFAVDFTASVGGNWKSPSTWGLGGAAGSFNAPGIKGGRADTANIPTGSWVNFEGPGRASGIHMELASLNVDGVVRGASGGVPIAFQTTGNITVGSSGSIGGSNTSASKNKIDLQSGGDTTINGTVQGEAGGVKVRAGGNITVGGTGIVNSQKRSVNVTSTGGSVTIAAGGKVTARRNVGVQAGPGKPITVAGQIKSEKGNVDINGKQKQSQAGNVTVPVGGSIEAPNGEVKIKADTLRVAGTIKGHTVQKTCNVLIIEPGGSIESELSAKNKIVAKKKVVQPQSDAAEKSRDCQVIFDEFSVADYSGAIGPVLSATDFLRLATGPMGTLDLTGILPGTQVFECPGAIEIFADNILLDPGVLLEELAGPGFLTWGPSMPIFEVATLAIDDPVAAPGFPGEVTFLVTNMGNMPDDFEITVTDSLGWPVPYPPTYIPLTPGGWPDTLITIPFDPPPWSIPDVDTNRLTVRVRSMGNPFEEYVESVYIPVVDVAEFKDVNVSLWELDSAIPGSLVNVQSWVMNTGFLADDYEITVGDALGWPLFPPIPILFLDSGADSILTTGLEIPSGVLDGETNQIYINAMSLSSPTVVFRDTVEILVDPVSSVADQLPSAADITHSCYPNPFNPTTTIAFRVPDPNAPVTAAVYDVNGHQLAELFCGVVPSGAHEVVWRGTDASGREMASGVFFYRITQGSHVATGKMILAK